MNNDSAYLAKLLYEAWHKWQYETQSQLNPRWEYLREDLQEKFKKLASKYPID